MVFKTGNGIIFPNSGPLIKKCLLQHLFHIYQGVQNWFSKQEMKLSKQEMVLFLPLPDLWSKNFFYNIFSILPKKLEIGFQNRKWNYPKRKWNYFSRFQVSDHKTFFTTSYPYEPKRLNIGFQNRKWNYLSHFWASDQKTSFTKSSPYLPTNTKLILKTGNVIITTLGSILDSQLA